MDAQGFVDECLVPSAAAKKRRLQRLSSTGIALENLHPDIGKPTLGQSGVREKPNVAEPWIAFHFAKSASHAAMTAFKVHNEVRARIGDEAGHSFVQTATTQSQHDAIKVFGI